MKKIITFVSIFVFLLAFIPHNSATAVYYLEIEGVKGESTETSSADASVKMESKTTASPTRATSETSASGDVVVCTMDAKMCPDGSYVGRVAPACEFAACPSTSGDRDVSTDDDEASAGGYIKIGDIKGESEEEARKKGNVEYGWKVEEGEKLEDTGVEPDEIDIADDTQPTTPDFSILLGGGSDDEEDAVPEDRRSEVAQIVLAGLREEGIPAEGVALGREKIETKVVERIKLFGFIPVSATAEVEITATNEVSVKYPWWSFLASGKKKTTLGIEISSAIEGVLESKHDTVKNSINNVR